MDALSKPNRERRCVSRPHERQPDRQFRCEVYSGFGGCARGGRRKAWRGESIKTAAPDTVKQKKFASHVFAYSANAPWVALSATVIVRRNVMNELVLPW